MQKKPRQFSADGAFLKIVGLLLRSEWVDVNPAAGFVEFDLAVAQCKKGEVASESDIAARMKFCSSLADDDIAGDDRFAAEFFDTEAFALAIAAVAGCSLSFFLCHFC